MMCHRICARVLVLLLATPLAAQSGERPQDFDPVALDVTSTITEVTVYVGRASVTRVARLDLEPNVYEIQFGPLPDALEADTIQARPSGPLRVLGVDVLRQDSAGLPPSDVASLDGQIQVLERKLKELSEQYAVVDAKRLFIESIMTLATDDARDKLGSREFNVDAIRDQLQFIAQEQLKLLEEQQALDRQRDELERRLTVLVNERRAWSGGGALTKTAVVTVRADVAAASSLELTYLVAGASWSPRYNVRSRGDYSSVLLEYDAVISQRTGEDWSDVRLSVSTAQPMVAASPPGLEPWFIDVYDLAVDDADAPVVALDEVLGQVRADQAGLTDRESTTRVGGPSVTFTMPRAVTVRSDAQNVHRTRIIAIDTEPTFVHVAVPLLTNAVYLRADLVNASSFHLLPGTAGIFVGQDYIGPSRIESVAPRGLCQLYFGIDPSVQTNRRIVGKKTSRTGLLGGGLKTSYDYRIEIENGRGRTLNLEMWDRVPVSRDERVVVDVVAMSRPLSTDADYLENERPQGLLKWQVSIPADSRAPYAWAVTWGVRVNRSKDTEITPLLE